MSWESVYVHTLTLILWQYHITLVLLFYFWFLLLLVLLSDVHILFIFHMFTANQSIKQNKKIIIIVVALPSYSQRTVPVENRRCVLYNIYEYFGVLFEMCRSRVIFRINVSVFSVFYFTLEKNLIWLHEKRTRNWKRNHLRRMFEAEMNKFLVQL